MRRSHRGLTSRLKYSAHRSSKHLSNGRVTGIIIAIVGVLVIVLALYMYSCRQKRSTQPGQLKNPPGSVTGQS